MPVWDKKCTICEALFEVNCKFAEKELPKECPNCGSLETEYRIGNPAISRHSERLMTHRQDGGFKEVLQKIAERHPRTPLATGRNSGERAMG
jgi:putative FmdB family regulatory protein